MDKLDVKNLSKEEIKHSLVKAGQPAYRAGQIYRWLYRIGSKDFSQMVNVPSPLRRDLSDRFYISQPKLLNAKRSDVDGTSKYLLMLEDRNTIETVYLPEKKRASICISSQVGCKYACRFCASGACGFVRDLEVSEILNQVLFLKVDERLTITNIVFMGIGEPLDNYDNVMKAIRILNDRDGLDMGARRMTISTCGIIPGIRRLSDEGIQVELSVSLHSASDKIRSELMPINKKYPLDDLMRCCRDYIKKTKRIITFEYVMIKGLNGSRRDAAELAKLLKNIKCKVNLIAYNEISLSGFSPPADKERKIFVSTLRRRGVNAILRKSRGEDIDAGCGQLRISHP